MITVQTDSRDVCAVTYVGVRSNAFRAINHSIKPNFQPKSIPPPFLFASPLLSLPIIWIRESKLNLFYKRRIIDPLKVFIIIIYSLFQKQLKIIINRISSERVRTFANSASIDHLCSNRARTCVCVCVTKSHGKNVAYLAGHVSFYPCTRFNSWDLKILRVPTFHLKVTSSSIYHKASLLLLLRSVNLCNPLPWNVEIGIRLEGEGEALVSRPVH